MPVVDAIHALTLPFLPTQTHTGKQSNQRRSKAPRVSSAPSSPHSYSTDTDTGTTEGQVGGVGEEGEKEEGGRRGGKVGWSV